MEIAVTYIVMLQINSSSSGAQSLKAGTLGIKQSKLSANTEAAGW